MTDKSRERNPLSANSRNQSFSSRRGRANFLINEPEEFDYLMTTDDSAAPSGAQTPRHMRVDSKEHLGEMATNIRGISMALSKVCISLKVHSILVVTKLSDDSLPACARELAEWILSSKFADHGLTVSVQDVFKEKKTFGFDELLAKIPRAEKQLRFWSSKSFRHDVQNYDMVITLGGDGTVLFTSWIFQEVVPPVLSFSMGSLSFMTEHNFDNFKDVVTASLDEGISATLRMRLCCTIMRTKRPEQTGECDLRKEIESSSPMQQFSQSHFPGERYVILNDVVVDRGPNPVMTMTELYGNYEYITSISADGVVISTPSGSTAYSMSAGGPLTHPDIPATLVTPVCPHSLSFRPLLLPDSMVLKIGVPYDARSPAFASFDGKKRIKLNRGDFMLVTASRYPFPKIIPKSFTSVAWVQQLSNGLHWNDVRRPKRLTY